MCNGLIWKLIFYKFELGHNVTEAIKTLCCAKGESKVDNSTVVRWLEKFGKNGNNLNDQAKSGKPKTMDSKAVHQTIEANPASRTPSIK